MITEFSECFSYSEDESVGSVFTCGNSNRLHSWSRVPVVERRSSAGELPCPTLDQSWS